MFKDLVPKTYYWLEVETFTGKSTIIFWLFKWVNGNLKETIPMVNPSFGVLCRQLLYTLPFPVFTHPMDQRYLYRYLIARWPDPIGKFIASTIYFRKHW